MIAREAGCSPSTVSRVLNGCKDGFSVRQELRDKIVEIARRQSFKPNPYLRALKAKRSNLIAILDIPYFQSGVIERAKRSFVGAIRRMGLKESLNYVEYGKPETYTLEFPVDAAIIFDVHDKSTLNYFETNRIPYVVINGVCGPNGISLMVDERGGSFAVLEHLRSLGHSRIAYANQTGSSMCQFVHVPKDNPEFGYAAPALSHYSIAARENAYLEYLDSHGLLPVPGHWSKEVSPESCLKAALDSGATAILCYEHIKAVHLAYAAWGMGLSIPKDFSLACFNNEFPVWAMTPPLTCVEVPGCQMGLAAAEMVGKLRDGALKAEGQTFKFEETLVVRQSTAAPPGK